MTKYCKRCDEGIIPCAYWDCFRARSNIYSKYCSTECELQAISTPPLSEVYTSNKVEVCAQKGSGKGTRKATDRCKCGGRMMRYYAGKYYTECTTCRAKKSRKGRNHCISCGALVKYFFANPVCDEECFQRLNITSGMEGIFKVHVISKVKLKRNK